MKMFGKGDSEDNNVPTGKKFGKKKPIPGKMKKQISGMADEMASAAMPKKRPAFGRY